MAIITQPTLAITKPTTGIQPLNTAPTTSLLTPTTSLLTPTSNNLTLPTTQAPLNKPPVTPKTPDSGLTGYTPGMTPDTSSTPGTPVNPLGQGPVLATKPVSVVSSNQNPAGNGTLQTSVTNANKSQTVTGTTLSPDGQSTITTYADGHTSFSGNTTNLNADGTVRGTTPADTKPVVPQTLDSAQLDTINHPGQVQLFNQATGTQDWVAPGVAGYGTQDPNKRTDIVATAQPGNGFSIRQLGDGTYQTVNTNTGMVVGSADAGTFAAAKRVEATGKAFDDAKQGIYNPAQQQQMEATKAQYQAVIDQITTTEAETKKTQVGGLDVFTGGANIESIINQNLAQIKQQEIQRDAALAKLTEGFLTDDNNAMQETAQTWQTSIDQINKTLADNQAIVQDAANKIKANQASVNDSYAKKYPEAGILSSDSQATLQEKLKNDATFTADQATKAGQVDQNVLDGMLKIYNKAGTIPAGMGNQSVALKRAFYAAIGKAPALADEATLNKVALAAAGKSLSAQNVQLNGTQTSVGTVKSSMDRVDKFISPLIDTGSPLLNQPLRYLSGTVLGSTTYNAFQNEMNTIATEYAKVIEGSSASIAGVSVSGPDEIKKAFNDTVTVGQLDSVLSAMKQDMNARLVSQQSTITQIKSDILQMGNVSTSAGTYDASQPLDWSNMPL